MRVFHLSRSQIVKDFVNSFFSVVMTSKHARIKGTEGAPDFKDVFNASVQDIRDEVSPGPPVTKTCFLSVLVGFERALPSPL